MKASQHGIQVQCVVFLGNTQMHEEDLYVRFPWCVDLMIHFNTKKGKTRHLFKQDIIKGKSLTVPRINSSLHNISND